MRKISIIIILLALHSFSCISKNSNLNFNEFSIENPKHIIDIAESYINDDNIKLTNYVIKRNERLINLNIPKKLTHSHLQFLSLKYNVSREYADVTYLIKGTLNIDEDEDKIEYKYCSITLRVNKSGECSQYGSVGTPTRIERDKYKS